MQTDKAVIGAVDANNIVVVDSSVIATATNSNPNNPNNPNSGGGQNPAVVAALQTNYDFSMPPIPSGLIFLSPGSCSRHRTWAAERADSGEPDFDPGGDSGGLTRAGAWI